MFDFLIIIGWHITETIPIWESLPATKEEVYVFVSTPELVCLSVCLSVCLCARLLKNACMIWMKCCVSTDVGTWTN